MLYAQRIHDESGESVTHDFITVREIKVSSIITRGDVLLGCTCISFIYVIVLYNSM